MHHFYRENPYFRKKLFEIAFYYFEIVFSYFEMEFSYFEIAILVRKNSLKLLEFSKKTFRQVEMIETK